LVEGGGADEDRARRETWDKLRADPEHYLDEYTKRFGNVLNADDAATLFDEYNADPMKYRAAVHRAATWIRDELFRRALEENVPDEKDRVAFTAGSNAAGKSTAIEFSGAGTQAQVVFDSTFSNPGHARRLVDQVLAAGRRVSILYIRRPLDDAFQGMLERAGKQKRIVTIQQLIGSDRGAAETVRGLWHAFEDDPRFAFQFVDNSTIGNPRLSTIELAAPRDYTGVGEHLHELLDAEYQAARISEAAYQRIRGSQEPGQPPVRGTGGSTGSRGSP
jgi:hypothetical protein